MSTRDCVVNVDRDLRLVTTEGCLVNFKVKIGARFNSTTVSQEQPDRQILSRDRQDPLAIIYITLLQRLRIHTWDGPSSQ